jgi:phytoene synthase
MARQNIRQIFRKGSRTYFSSSQFFPRHIQENVFRLYGFVRSADNFVDVIPQREEDFYALWEKYRQSLDKNPVGDYVIDGFTDLMREKNFKSEWVEAFFLSMEMDLKKKSYATLGETKAYIHGSAEVIGLMMAAIMELDPDSHTYAALLGRAMQFINFIRDIKEDHAFGRNYFPQEDMQEFRLKSLDISDVLDNRSSFEKFVHTQIMRYKDWQSQAEQGFRFVPRRCLIPIKTASEMYKWTALQIEKYPLIVYKRKVKPSKIRIWRMVLNNFLSLRS